MQNSFLEHEAEKWRYLIFCTVAGFIAFSTNISHLILDSVYLFHEGEYVGLLWHMRSFYSGEIAFPLLIHGAMDYIPAIAASYIYGDAHVIVGTRAINTIIAGLCWVLFLDLCYLLSSKTSQRAFWMAIAIVIFIAIAPSANSEALKVQQAFLGTRDLFVLGAVWSLAKYTAPTSPIRQRLFLLAGTFSAVFAIFWSYDRGILALAFLGVIFLGAMKNKKTLDAILIVLAACLSLWILDSAHVFGSLSDNLRNIGYWIKNASEVFGTNASADFPSLIISSIILIFCTTTIVFAFAKRAYWDKRDLVFILGIIAIQIILLQTVMNRPGMPRLSWAIWPSVLIMIYFGSRRFSLKCPMSDLSMKFLVHVHVAYKAYVSIVLILIYVMSPYFFGHGYFVKNLIKPKLDMEIVSIEVSELSNALRQNDDQCILGWMNEGIVALLVKKRFCTQFPYAIYVSKGEESNFLKQLSADLPMAIVFDVTGSPMMNLDKRSMASRLPKVNKFIQDTYLEKQQLGRYLVVTKSVNHE